MWSFFGTQLSFLNWKSISPKSSFIRFSDVHVANMNSNFQKPNIQNKKGLATFIGQYIILFNIKERLNLFSLLLLFLRRE